MLGTCEAVQVVEGTTLVGDIRIDQGQPLVAYSQKSFLACPLLLGGL